MSRSLKKGRWRPSNLSKPGMKLGLGTGSTAAHFIDLRSAPR